MSTPPVFPPFRPDRTRIANLVPFTYRDTKSLLELLYHLQDYVIALVPELDKEIDRLIEQFQKINNDQMDQFNQEFIDFVEHVNELVSLINNKTGPVDVQHITLTSNLNFSVDPLFPSNHIICYVFTQDGVGGRSVTVTGNINGTILVDRSPNSRTMIFAVPKEGGGWVVFQPAQKSEIMEIRDDLGEWQHFSGDRYNRYQYGGERTGMPFRKLQDIAKNPYVSNAIFFLGSSTINGSTVVTNAGGMNIPARFAAALGAKSLRLPSSDTSGSRVYNCGINGSRADNYLTTDILNAIQLNKPAYVFHAIGSNDMNASHPPALYETNVRAAIAQIDAVSPNTIHVLIHAQERYNKPMTYPWKDYGAVLKLIASTRPTDIQYLDIDTAFQLSGIPKANRFHLMGPDEVHLTNHGYKLFSDVLIEFCGLSNWLKNSVTYLWATVPNHPAERIEVPTNIVWFEVEPDPLPRLIDFDLSFFCRSREPSEFYLGLMDEPNGVSVRGTYEAFRVRRSSTGDGDSFFVSHKMRIDPTTEKTYFGAYVKSVGGSEADWFCNLSTAARYFNARATVSYLQ